MAMVEYDVVTIGRASVDLYGQQTGGPLEDVASFEKAVGGCAANIAIGVARLGLRSALITRVGDEPMGRFILEQLTREGVSRESVAVDAKRLTALVLVGVRDAAKFPLIFYRENCADMGLSVEDINERVIASSRVVVVTGTHFSQESTSAAQWKAMRIARSHGRIVCLDIDYRPSLWGEAGHDEGDTRYVRSASVAEQIQAVLPSCDLVVGTEEEIHLAGGSEDTLRALRRIRELSHASIVCKRGSKGCIVFPGAIPDSIESGVVGAGFDVEIYNVLGAGDAFLAGFLLGYLRGQSMETACTYANACGALAVSRLMCSREFPGILELNHFLKNGSKNRAVRFDAALNHLHWVTTRRPYCQQLMALAIDHRTQLEAIADAVCAPHERIGRFKELAVIAAARVADGRPGYGILLDDRYGREALFRAADHSLWIGRPVEKPGSRPLEFEDTLDVGGRVRDWPVDHAVKCLCIYHARDPAALREAQEVELRRLYEAVRREGRDLLIEIIAGRHATLETDTVAEVLERLYSLHIKPDWWKLEPQPNIDAWHSIERVIARHDPWCRGIVLLGLDAPEAALETAFSTAAASNLVKGFAVGRTIFGEIAARWLGAKIDDTEAVDAMAAGFSRLCEAWQRAVAGRSVSLEPTTLQERTAGQGT